jgi:hypothetical protein
LFNFSCSTNLKKKNKYAKIDFTSHHSFLRVRLDQFRQNCKKTHPIVDDPSAVPPGFYLKRQEWVILNRFRT